MLGDILKNNGELTSALRLRLMDSDFSWQALIDLGNSAGPVASAYPSTFRACPITAGPARGSHYRGGHVALRLQQFYREHLARRELQKAQMQNVLRHLNRAGIVPLILKGARYLVAAVAAWCEARTFRDIDLLVRPDEANRAFAELVTAGYWPGEPYMANYHHLPDLQHPNEPASVEIHTGPLAVAGLSVMSTDLACDAGFLTLSMSEARSK